MTPDQIGLPPGRNRRVPGLRREEVATAAGLSVDYYTRLEQGRERNPSPSVLTALARTLRLEPDAQRYLYAMAIPSPRTPRPRRQQVGQNLLDLLAEWTNHPTLLVDGCHNVVAGNQLGLALFGGHAHSDNMARLMFLDPIAPRLFREWDQVSAACVAAIRAAASHDPYDAELTALVGELSVRSEHFSRLWAKADVREKTTVSLLLAHPVVGDLDLVMEMLQPGSAPGLRLKIYRAAPGSESAEKLAVLGSLSVDETTGRERSRERG